jgi:hypothetical protein
MGVYETSVDQELDIANVTFQYVCDIEPERNPDGAVCRYMPQERYANERELSLNRYGEGPFCKFKIPANWSHNGVYALVVEGAVRYIGECVNLSSRYNMGYGNISPRNCFVGGQETNCRINSLIFTEAQQQKRITLWFCRTNDYKGLESQLRVQLQLDWNRN